MKKTILLIAFMLICFGIKALAGNDETCFVKAGDKMYFGKDIKTGITHTKLISFDGSVAEFDNHEVTAYKHHNRLYMLMPVICDNNDVLCLAMMEYLNTKSGYSVFRYCCPKNTEAYFVYKDGKYYRRITEDQVEGLEDYGIKVLAVK